MTPVARVPVMIRGMLEKTRFRNEPGPVGQGGSNRATRGARSRNTRRSRLSTGSSKEECGSSVSDIKSYRVANVRSDAERPSAINGVTG